MENLHGRNVLECGHVVAFKRSPALKVQWVKLELDMKLPLRQTTPPKAFWFLHSV